MDPRLAANRANWDDRVPIHMASSFYDVEGWLAGPRRPRAWEQEALGDLEDLRLLHLQCHIGLDSLAFAGDGAYVTGLDFSSSAIDQARALATRAGLDDRARFVEGDVLEAVEVLSPATYDVVYVSIGSMCWVPSIARWAEQVEGLLAPGGRLFVHDEHPLAWALGTDDLCVEESYFEEAEPLVIDDEVTYADGEAQISNRRHYEWNHSLGEIVAALLGRNLHLERLTEHDWTLWRRFDWLEATSDGRWRVPSSRPRVPLSFTLMATRAPQQVE